MGDEPSPAHFIRSRVANACDGCKSRKVKCDGQLPCAFCFRRRRSHLCRYSAPKTRRVSTRTDAESERLSSSPRLSTGPSILTPRRTAHQRRRSPTVTPVTQNGTSTRNASSLGETRHSRGQSAAELGNGNAETVEEETEVPREARLHTDGQGKLIFIGDCAPLSFFQSVRQLVTSRVDQAAFAPDTSRYSVLPNAPSNPGMTGTAADSDSMSSRRYRWPGGSDNPGGPVVNPDTVRPAIDTYLSTTSGMLDLFDNSRLHDDLQAWANTSHQPQDVPSLVNYLVLAVGLQGKDQDVAQCYFAYAREAAYGAMTGISLGGIEIIQVFVLITMYMVCSCQVNGAFLFFGIAVRAAYSAGLHRTEVNARFGTGGHRQRDRLWKSLRAMDLFLSTCMGRPPATSDVDCTVPYRDQPSQETHSDGALDVLNASVQILLIMEGIVVNIYSKRRISLQQTDGVSRQLREWSNQWLDPLKERLNSSSVGDAASLGGPCQVLATYYYAVMLVSRPFLMYELCRQLEDDNAEQGLSRASGRTKLAGACVDAASLMVETVTDLISQGSLKDRLPILVNWLFAASLVLSLGLLGGFGRILELYANMSIQALDHFAEQDAHAQQYSLIAQSLLTTALEHLERQELEHRLRRTETSSQLFGLRPSRDHRQRSGNPEQRRGRISLQASVRAQSPSSGLVPEAADLETSRTFGSSILGLTDSMYPTPEPNYWTTSLGEGDEGSTLNLFPLLDGGAGIDLAHYL